MNISTVFSLRKIGEFVKQILLAALVFNSVNSALFAQNLPGKTADSSMAITIHQESYFNTSPEKLYEVLMSSGLFSKISLLAGKFTVNSAKIDSVVGGSFSVFDGHIIGRILELVPNQRIVEAWRVVDWPAGVYSIARFEIRKKGEGSEIIFDHIGFPPGLKDHLAIGWQQHYWDPMSKYFK